MVQIDVPGGDQRDRANWLWYLDDPIGELPMSAVRYAPPAPPLDLSDPLTATRVCWLRFPAGWSDDAHPSPRRQLFVVLAGRVEGRTSTGDTRHFEAGDCLLMEDTTGKGHGARPLDGDALAILVALDDAEVRSLG